MPTTFNGSAGLWVTRLLPVSSNHLQPNGGRGRACNMAVLVGVGTRELFDRAAGGWGFLFAALAGMTPSLLPTMPCFFYSRPMAGVGCGCYASPFVGRRTITVVSRAVACVRCGKTRVAKYSHWLALSTELGKVRLPTAAQQAFVSALENSVAELAVWHACSGAVGGLSLPSPTLASLPPAHPVKA